MNLKLYHHKTDGGAEYLCTSPIEGTDEGDLFTAIIRLDGEPELLNPTTAAGEELFEALRDIVGMCNRTDVKRAMMKHDQAYYHGVMHRANKALRKAEGES